MLLVDYFFHQKNDFLILKDSNCASRRFYKAFVSACTHAYLFTYVLPRV